MPATIYSPPAEVGDPPAWERGMDFRVHMQEEEAWENQVIEWARANGSGKYAGEVFRWQIADGYARYVIYRLRPLELIWLGTGDAWQMPDVVARGLTAADVRRDADFRRSWAELTK